MAVASKGRQREGHQLGRGLSVAPLHTLWAEGESIPITCPHPQEPFCDTGQDTSARLSPPQLLTVCLLRGMFPWDSTISQEKWEQTGENQPSQHIPEQQW